MCKIYVLSEKVVRLKRAMLSKWEKTLCEGDKSVSKRGKKLSKIWAIIVSLPMLKVYFRKYSNLLQLNF